MTDKLIQAPLGIWGSLGTGQAEQKLIECTVSPFQGTLTHGDVVIIETATSLAAAFGGSALNVSGTTTPKSPLVVGVISAGDPTTNATKYLTGQVCQVCIGGVARVQIGAQAAAAGSFLQTSAITLQGLGNAAPAAADIGTIFGIALEAAAAKDVNNTIRCLIRSA